MARIWARDKRGTLMRQWEYTADLDNLLFVGIAGHAQDLVVVSLLRLLLQLLRAPQRFLNLKPRTHPGLELLHSYEP